MSTIPNMEDPNQTVFYIPFAGEENRQKDDVPLLKPLDIERDLHDGEQLRVEAYREAWKKCLVRVKSIIHTLHESAVENAVLQVQTSYNNILPGLPYPELPVICITNPTSGSAFIHEITAQIDSTDFEDGTLFDTPCFTTHLYPTDCVNLTSTMKAMISGFVDRPHILKKVKSRPAVSLASYDIELLVAWYAAIRAAYDIEEKYQPKLVVLLHDFEQLDSLVIKDLFSISSLYIQRVPLVFILSLSSPSSPSYLHATYPRSTLALLRIRNIVVPSGPRVLEEILLKTFFDTTFEPDIMIGPGVLRFLIDYFTRQDSSLDSVLTILHLAHLKHFSAEPLTLLVRSTPPSGHLAQPSAFPFLDALFSRLHVPSQNLTPPNATNWSSQTLLTLIDSMNAARMNFYARAQRLRIGFGIVKLVQDFMTQQGYKGLDWGKNLGGVAILEVMTDVLRGSIAPDIKLLGTMVKKLTASQLSALLKALHTHINSMPSKVRSNEEGAQTKMMSIINALPERLDEGISEVSSQLANSFAEWLVEYLNDTLVPLENVPLWDIWYTGLSQFPSDLINPSVRATVVSGLLRPHDFAEPTDDNGGDDNPKEQPGLSLWELPDTSILFRRYLDSGKMINVYDWFESFQLVMETQRKKLKKEQVGELGSRSPAKRSGRGKGKEVQRQGVTNDSSMEVDDEDTWKLQVQARFIRALHELDYIGFIKHTGRKPDHVLRTAFDIQD